MSKTTLASINYFGVVKMHALFPTLNKVGTALLLLSITAAMVERNYATTDASVGTLNAEAKALLTRLTTFARNGSLD